MSGGVDTRNAPPAVIELIDVSKVYALGELEVAALRDVSLAHRRGRVRRDHRPVGLRASRR